MSRVDYYFSKPEESTGFLLWQVTMTWQRKMNRALDECALTHTQFVILAALGWLLQSGKEVNQKDIADHSNTDRMMVSKILRKLQKNGLIDRQESAQDARSKSVSLTAQGKGKLQQALKIVHKTDTAFFNKLTDQPTFDAELIRLWTK